MNTYDPKQQFEDETQGELEEQPTTLSLLGGIAKAESQGEDDLSFALDEPTQSNGNLLSHTTILIVIVAVVAAGSLYAMRWSQGSFETDSSVIEVEAKVDNWLTKLSDPTLMASDDPVKTENLASIFNTHEMLNVLAADSTQHQVPIQYVQKNPFMFAFADPTGGAVTGNVPDSAHARQKRLMELKKELNKYQVSSIMASSTRKVAVINNELYQVGNHLGNFVIDDMDKMTVIVRHGDDRFALSIKTTH